MAIYIKPITSTPKSNIDAERKLELEIEAEELARRNEMFPGYKPSFTSQAQASAVGQMQAQSSPVIPWAMILLGVAVFFMLENK